MENNVTKAKMTRKEAIECFKKHMPAVVNPERCIDFYIEAGMLEIVEEKKVVTIDIVDECLVIIKRNGKWIYED